MFLARDRFGVRPLFYAQRNGDLYFGSEIKAIVASGEVDPALDPRGLDEVLKFGASRAPRTAFSGIAALEPGTYGTWQDGALWLRHYYEVDYPEASGEPPDVIEQLDELMLRSVGMRLRAEVPVGASLSGGLDSSITASLARSASAHPLQSFSIACGDTGSDDTLRQEEVASAVGSVHTALVIRADTVLRSLPEVLWHTETPVLGTAPALMFHLAKRARESGVNVLIGGDGADEVFLGNDVFKEMSVRRFCLRRPESHGRRRLFERIDLGISPDATESPAQLLGEFARTTDPLFSHLPRFRSSRMDDLYAAEFKQALAGIDVIAELRASLPTRFFGWSPLNQASYLEMTTRLSPYLISSCGDRMTMAHGVEGRYPFLDHRVFEFAAALPTGSRLRGLQEKEVLRRWATRILPAALASNRKPHYRSQDAQSFFLRTSLPWVADHLTDESLRRVGIFCPSAVGALLRRCQAGPSITRSQDRAIVGVLTTQLWYRQFMESALSIPSLPASAASVLLGDTVSRPLGEHAVDLNRR
jgi:asparagine synthase (glutamine-hydrolysing)